jgi:phospholipid transport system substrate-binding protein
MSSIMIVRGVAVAVVCIVVLGAAIGAAAGPPTDQLKDGVERVLKVLEDPSLKGEGRAAERRAVVRKIAQEIFDFPEMARRSLGRHWQTFTQKQREEFTALFRDLLERAYLSRIEQYGGERISYVNERIDGDNATVGIRIIGKSGSDVPVDYRLLRSGDRWLVYDVNIEGVSLVSNYRTQFNKIMQTSGYDDLIQRLKTKQGDLDTGDVSKDKKSAPAKK